MSLLEYQTRLTGEIKRAAGELFQIEPETVVAEIPPKTELGDLAFPVAFELAKLIKQQTGEKQNPRAIAEKFKTALENSISSNA